MSLMFIGLVSHNFSLKVDFLFQSFLVLIVSEEDLDEKEQLDHDHDPRLQIGKMRFVRREMRD